jgi:transposase-like protein
MGSTQTHKREAVLLYLQGHLTSEIARQIQHAPEDVDRYLYDYQRVIELAEEGKSTSQSSFVTALRPHLVREYISLWREMKALKETESASETLDKEKEKDAPAEQD